MDETAKIIEWAFRWSQNVHQGREFTVEEWATAAEHYRRGIDAWESAAAICEGRRI